VQSDAQIIQVGVERTRCAAPCKPRRTADLRAARQRRRHFPQTSAGCPGCDSGTLPASGDPDFAQAAADALSRNSGDLTTLLGRVYGSARAKEFRRLWESQQEGLVGYARATSQHDQAAKAAARRQLDASPGRIAQFLHDLTPGGAAAPAISSRLGTHIDDLIRFTDAYAAGDYAMAYRIERVDYERQFALGTVIAAGIVGGRGGELRADFDSPLTRLRSTLGELLGEHMQLVVDAMGAALRGGPEFRADAAQVNADTAQLANAFGVLFGPRSATRFESVWGDHVDALVSYSGAVAAEDQKGKDQALAQLHAFELHLSAFLSTSTEGRLRAPALSETLHMHDRDLVGQLDAYARGDYTTAYGMTYEGYQHMFEVAMALSGAIHSGSAGSAFSRGCWCRRHRVLRCFPNGRAGRHLFEEAAGRDGTTPAAVLIVVISLQAVTPAFRPDRWKPRRPRPGRPAVVRVLAPAWPRAWVGEARWQGVKDAAREAPRAWGTGSGAVLVSGGLPGCASCRGPRSARIRRGL